MNLPNGHLLQNRKYRLTHVVGQGGFGITYKGVWFTEVKGPLGTIKTEVPICVKEYFFKDYCYRDPDSFEVKVHSETGRALFEKFKEKLIKEAKILSDVHHPHIVNVLEVFEENNTAYIAMEYISGNSLKYMMDKEGVLPEARVLRYVHQIGEALQFVHEKNVLHLDIKPSNILIDQSGKARLIDFGVSKRYDIEQQETSTTMLTLSKGFASIEQYDNEGTQNFSPCPDIYSLGATMYNLLTGKIPTESILRATRPLPVPRELNPAISSKTEAAIIKAMEIVPADRFQSVSEMLVALDFPEAEEEEIKKDISSPEYFEEDETTILFTTRLPQSKTDEGDETVLNNVDQPSIPKKKKRKVTLISLLIIIFASIASAWVLLVQRNKPVPPVVEVLNAAPKGNSDPVSETVATDIIEKNNMSAVAEEEPRNGSDEKNIDNRQTSQEKPAVKSEVTTSRTETAKPPKESTVKDIEKTVVTPSVPSEEEINAEFETLITSGKSKMAEAQVSNGAADFAKATEEISEAGLAFSKAAKLKTTDELIDLIGKCKVKEEEILLAGRKAQYEEIKPFGDLMIVQKKDTKKYGAIDANARERVKCKYLAAYRTQQGYGAFVREDELFDIYNTEGVMISERLPDYY
ncbi:serine/threonine protein kinase [Parabacteroides faecis]|uniref:serine/threonine protein kinase n=1 Tax=Parabacteroides faecis TaxID=1217282 RepID=UPI00216424E5|nr:serine/threonine-protein kinase [Parabacteroides faecis]MCS2893124.1 serine/threonine protein kinase [Parabacteroides faecis]UVQ48267.1 serine/threonine protein kinase [Parabacteroides faecis]